jgi:hypothetical protein
MPVASPAAICAPRLSRLRDFNDGISRSVKRLHEDIDLAFRFRSRYYLQVALVARLLLCCYSSAGRMIKSDGLRSQNGFRSIDIFSVIAAMSIVANVSQTTDRQITTKCPAYCD